MEWGVIEFTLLIMFLMFLGLVAYREYKLKTE
jgi:hypothetical protein